MARKPPAEKIKDAAQKLRDAERRYREGLARITTPAQRKALMKLSGLELAKFIRKAKLGRALNALTQARVRAIEEVLSCLRPNSGSGS